MNKPTYEELAAQVEIMRSALELAFISVRTCYKQDWAPFKDVTTVEKAIKLAPSHCLAEIRAEAVESLLPKCVLSKEHGVKIITESIVKYMAEQIRQGGVK